MCKLHGGSSRTSEEFHSAYETQRKTLECAFAQTPSQTSADAGGWYDTKLAATRCRAHYEYDPAGRLYWIGHYWDTLTNGYYASQAILGQYCDYEVNTGSNRGLKLHSKYETPSSQGSSTFQIAQTDTYGYDSSLDYLTSANYGDGLANATQTWNYDAAGNRNDAVTDNLNRATSIGGVSCSNDLLGNRLTKGTNTFGWDQLNRMKTYNSTTYTYRSDGMRTYKTNSSGSTSYRYDGQMGMEDVDYTPTGAVSKVTDFGIGGRGIDAFYVTQNGTTSASYPIYDAHGNMISTLARQGTGNYTTSALRTFDGWGQIRIGTQTGDPKGRYCANLGHKQDDESGLTYMRARYYEPISGRFIGEDPGMHGQNLFLFCSNDPVNKVDQTGRVEIPLVGMILESIFKWYGWKMSPTLTRVCHAMDSIIDHSLICQMLVCASREIWVATMEVIADAELGMTVGGPAAPAVMITAMESLVILALIVAIDGIDDAWKDGCEIGQSIFH